MATWNVEEDERNISRKLDIDSYKYIIGAILKEDIEVIYLQKLSLNQNI